MKKNLFSGMVPLRAISFLLGLTIFLGANAEEDYTSSITNPSFETGTISG